MRDHKTKQNFKVGTGELVQGIRSKNVGKKQQDYRNSDVKIYMMRARQSLMFVSVIYATFY